MTSEECLTAPQTALYNQVLLLPYSPSFISGALRARVTKLPHRFFIEFSPRLSILSKVDFSSICFWSISFRFLYLQYAILRFFLFLDHFLVISVKFFVLLFILIGISESSSSFIFFTDFFDFLCILVIYQSYITSVTWLKPIRTSSVAFGLPLYLSLIWFPIFSCLYSHLPSLETDLHLWFFDFCLTIFSSFADFKVH